jgi:tyrosinase
MAYFQSPTDPIFFAHHAFVDALQVIYLKCQLGEEGLTLTADQKSSDPRFWTSCARRTGGNFSASDTLTMRARAASNSSTWVDVRTSPDNTLYPFFKDLPGTYQEYIDAKDLGRYNYTYSISGGLANLYINCKGANNITAVSSTETTTLMESSAHSHSCPRPTILPSTTEDVVMQYWTIAIFEAAKIIGYTDDAAREQMELIMCQHKQECLGGVDDYTDLFRTNFMVEGHPRCYTLIRDLKAGDRVIGVPKWRSITARFLPCRHRKRMIIRSSIE